MRPLRRAAWPDRQGAGLEASSGGAAGGGAPTETGSLVTDSTSGDGGGSPPTLRLADGEWVLDPAPMGTYRLRVEAAGFETLDLPLYVSRLGAQSLDLRLLRPDERPSGMVYVPAGPFHVGGSAPGDRTRRRATLPGFLIDRDEVTFAQYRAWLATLAPAEAQEREPREVEERPDLPVAGIRWEDARAYAHARGRRLPSEDEWAKAARGPDLRPYPFGARYSAGAPNLANPTERALPPGSRPGDLSPYGCRDMAGNVSEYVGDPFWPDRPRGPRARRGGAWSLAEHYARITYRDPIDPGERRVYLGFRCAQDLPSD